MGHHKDKESKTNFKLKQKPCKATRSGKASAQHKNMVTANSIQHKEPRT